MERVTEQQRKVLDFVGDFSTRNGYSPTLREIGEGVGLANVNAVRGHVSALERKGFLTREADKARSIRLVGEPSAFSRFKRMLHEVLQTDQGVLHRVMYGLAWTTRRREPHLAGPRAELMRQALEREAAEHGWTLLEARIEPDHVVVVVETWPNHSPEQTVRRFQAAGRALRRFDKREPVLGPPWGRGYAVTTDLDLLDELVERLLNEQKPGAAE